MAQQNITIGAADAKTGDTLFSAFTKTEANFTELYNGLASQAQNVVVINQESDFPTQDGTTITLDENTQFFIGSPFSTSKTFTVLNGSSLTSINPFSTSITYTGSGTMFNSSAASWQMRNIQVDCPLATVFNINGPFIFLMNDAQVLSCTNIGSITAAGSPFNSFVIDNSSIINVSGQGYVFSGAFTILSMLKTFSIAASATAKIIDLGSSTHQNIEFQNLQFAGPSGSIAISGLTSSGNVNANVVATVRDSILNGNAITSLSGITEQDVRWQFIDNSGVTDSRNSADSYLTTAETVTINTAGTFEQVNGSNWQTTVSDRFTSASSGIVTYIGERDIEVKISGYATVEKVGGGTDEIEIRFAVNGTTLERSGGTTQNADPTSVPLEALVPLTNGDEINFYVTNNTSTSNVIVNKASLVIVSA